MHPSLRKPLHLILMLLCAASGALAVLCLGAGLFKLFGTMYELGAMMQGLWGMAISGGFCAAALLLYWLARLTDGSAVGKLFETPLDIRRFNSWKLSMFIITALFLAGFLWQYVSF